MVKIESSKESYVRNPSVLGSRIHPAACPTTIKWVKSIFESGMARKQLTITNYYLLSPVIHRLRHNLWMGDRWTGHCNTTGGPNRYKIRRLRCPVISSRLSNAKLAFSKYSISNWWIRSSKVWTEMTITNHSCSIFFMPTSILRCCKVVRIW